MFHVNGWFRFRSSARAGTKWCNSCCVIGDSDFGAPALVEQLDASMVWLCSQLAGEHILG